MKLVFRIFLISTLILFGCKKKDSPGDPEPEPPVTPVTPEDTSFKCADLPPFPVPFGWTDSTTNPNENVKSFFFNPTNAEEVIAVVEGDAFGFNKMVNVNLRTGSRTTLAALDQFLPSINSKGWIVYSASDNNIYLIKANGDSLKQVTNLNIAHDPKWDASGNYFYFLQDAYFNVDAKLVKADPAGTEVHSLPQGNPLNVVLRKSNKVVLQKVGATKVTLVLKDQENQVETELISGPLSTGGAPFFNFLTVDQNDENLYWSNENGISKWNFASQKTETILKNCENTIFDCPIISHKSNEITYTMHTIKPISTYFLLHEFRAMELNTSTLEKREIRIFK